MTGVGPGPRDRCGSAVRLGPGAGTRGSTMRAAVAFLMLGMWLFRAPDGVPASSGWRDPALHGERRAARLTGRHEEWARAPSTEERRSHAARTAARTQRGLSPRAAGVAAPASAGVSPGPLRLAATAGQETGSATTPEGWRQAEPGYAWQFPRDHGSHPEYRIEWWYYTGNLAADGGRRFGYQVTFFRVGVDPAPENPSRWAVRDLHMAHLAVTDLGTGRHLFGERLDRGGLGWAGARTGTLDVWNGDWRASLDAGGHRLEGVDRSFGIDLRLEPGRGPTLHGENGLSRKGPSAGNASLYYSMTRMPTAGRVRLDGEWIDVTGASWMDHEFGTTFLEPGQVGWDWFSLQLEDGADVMVFQLRRADGMPDEHSAGTWVEVDGATALQREDVRLVPGRRWTSPASGAAYPVEWRVEVPGRAAILEVAAALDAQELDPSNGAGSTGRSWTTGCPVAHRKSERWGRKNEVQAPAATTTKSPDSRVPSLSSTPTTREPSSSSRRHGLRSRSSTPSLTARSFRWPTTLPLSTHPDCGLK